MFKEFKEFAMRGNVIDLAVGVVIGAAFGKIVDSLVKDIVMKGELHRLKEVMSKSREQGMVTFDQSLFDLFRQGVIGYNEALAHADSANDVRLMIKLDGGVAADGGMLNNVTLD